MKSYPSELHDGAWSLHEQTQGALRALADYGIAGGAVYHALVGATASEHGRTLIGRGRRALDTYRALGVRVEILE